MKHLKLFEQMEENNFIKSKKYLEFLFTATINKYKLNQKTNCIKFLNGVIEIVEKFDRLSEEQREEMNDLVRSFLLRLKDNIIENVGRYEYEIETLRNKIREIENLI